MHEAAHAVIHALGGSFVYGVQVAPEGASSWTTTGRKGHQISDVWGVCCVSDCPAWIALSWDEDSGHFIASRETWRVLIGAFANHPDGVHGASRMARSARRRLRAWVCGTLAGPIAEALYFGETPWIEAQPWVNDDAAIAEACCWLLPFRSELDHLIAATQTVLHQDEVKSRIQRLAVVLEEQGSLDDVALSDYLPPARREWPSSPRRRTA